MSKEKLKALIAGLDNGLVLEWSDSDCPMKIHGVLGSQVFIGRNILKRFAWAADDTKPHLFSLPMLTKEITVKGYNEGKPFVPVEWMKSRISNGDISCLNSVIHDPRWVNSLPKYIHDYLVQIHFNVFDLPEDQYIKAEESKVYEV